MNAVIRVAEPADAASACCMLCRAIAECCEPDHHSDPSILTAWLGNKTPENVAAWFACASQYSVVACSDDELIGVAIMNRQGKILLFYVLPEKRFTGTGKALLQALEAQAKQWGVRAMQVASTLSARDFYLRNGFSETGAVPTAFGTEAVSMSKPLPGSGRSPCRCGG